VKARGFLYAPESIQPAACTIGGNVAMNSGGPHTLKFGVTTNHVLGFEIVLPDGEVVWLGTNPKAAKRPMATICAGRYRLRGDVRIITRVLVRLIKAPQAYKTMLGVFESVDDASQTVSDIIAAASFRAPWK